MTNQGRTEMKDECGDCKIIEKCGRQDKETCSHLNQEQDRKQGEFEALTKPLIEWLNNNSNPHAHIIIDNRSAELSEGVCSVSTDKYLKD